MERVAVVAGAGIGGLATAVALRRAGWSVTVLERSEQARVAGAGLVLWPNAIHALRELGLGEAVERIGTPNRRAWMRRPDGKVLSRVDLEPVAERLGAPVLVVHRVDLHRVLLDAITGGPTDGPTDGLTGGLTGEVGVDVRWGTGVRGVERDGERPVVVDEAGRSWEADVVVAADGVGSVLRQVVEPGARVREAGYLAFRAVVPVEAVGEAALEGFVGGETVGVGYRFGCSSMGERGVYWYATVPGTEVRGSAEEQLAGLVAALGDWHRPVGELVRATDPGGLLCHAVTELDPLPGRFVHAVGRGGLVLVGDAAHAMTPNLGQGACLAIEDAVTLGAVLGDGDVPAGLGRYQGLRYGRAGVMVRRSRQAGAVMELRRPAAIAVRDWVASVVPGSWTARAAASAADWRPPRIGA